MSDLFVIAAGGTGAKVAEALIHLCAMGLGPREPVRPGARPPEVHVLLVDPDNANANRKRAVNTATLYGKLQEWDWRIRPYADRNHDREYFATKVTLYELDARLDRENAPGLQNLMQDDTELKEALRVLLDENDFRDELIVGFTGRPDLGSLVMERYLREKLSADARASEFVGNLIRSSLPHDSRPRVVVVGSAFGGTGASLIPVIRRCISSEFDRADHDGNPRTAHFPKLQWCKILQLPYFKPVRPKEVAAAAAGAGGATAPKSSRHLTDCASALWFYGRLNAAGEADEVTYLIGSESREKREVAWAEGGDRQINPAFYHEALGALAVLDFHRKPVPGGPARELVVRHFGSRKTEELCALERLPVPEGISQRSALLESLGALHQLAAFALFHRGETETQNGKVPEYYRGLVEYAKRASVTGWDRWVHASVSSAGLPTNQDGPGREALQYFARLLLWTRTTFGSSFGSAGIHFDAVRTYGELHNMLCEVVREEIRIESEGRPFREERDTTIARVCRMALVALHRVHQARGVASAEKTAPFPLLLEEQKLIRLGIPEDNIPKSLKAHDAFKQSDELEKMLRAYGGESLLPR